jgi:hypothetical protein
MNDSEALRVDGFNDCIIGTDYKKLRVVYSIERMLAILMERDGMSMEEAIEYFDFNIGGAYMGEMTPVYVWTEDNIPL